MKFVLAIAATLLTVSTVYCQYSDKCCPDTTGKIGACIEACNSCAKNQLCCSNGCGHVCTTPVPCKTDPCSLVRCSQCHTCQVVNGQAQCVPNQPSAECPCCCVGPCRDPLPSPCVDSPSCPIGK